MIYTNIYLYGQLIKEICNKRIEWNVYIMGHVQTVTV
jgi:hypothetical protein